MSEAILSVLVVEKHPMMREALCVAIASEAGLAVAGEASSGTEVVQMAGRLRPGAVLYALGGAYVEDLQALNELHSCLPDVSIVVLTDQEACEREKAVLSRIARAVLTKAAPRSEIIQALRRTGTW